MEQLEAEGLLSAEGRRFFAKQTGDAPRKGGAEGQGRPGLPQQPGTQSRQPAARPARPGRFADRPARSEDRPARSEDRPARFENRPARSEDRPARFENRPVRSEDRPARFEDRPVRADRYDDRPRPARPDRAGDRPARPARPDRYDDRPARPARPDRFEERPRPARPAVTGRPARHARPNEAEALVAERLHKVMAKAGVASRRHSEELIQAGRVTINGRVVTELGTKIVPGKDRIEVDGRPLGKPEDLIYILLNKPKGYVTTLYDPQGRPKVTDLLGEEIAQRVYPVGRLDYDTEGLLLLTNDGELANALMHPAREVKKTYIAKVRGVPGPGKIRELESGVELDDGPTAPAEVKLISANGPNAATLSVRIHEGRNRQVRRMFEAVGHEMIHLKRTTLGPLQLKDLPVGQFRELTEREIMELKGATGIKQAVNRSATRAAKVAAIVESRKARTRPGGRFSREDEPASVGAGTGEGMGRGPAAGPARGRGPRVTKGGFSKNRGPR
ncbi:MAG TPA: pseudouridine synthase [Symbiobacteriaceae bacterium]|nr:pseudouridine synthase [Symbiobacteriaceae bacterium]